MSFAFGSVGSRNIHLRLPEGGIRGGEREQLAVAGKVMIVIATKALVAEIDLLEPSFARHVKAIQAAACVHQQELAIP